MCPLLVLIVVEPRLETFWTESVGPTIQFHLENAQIHPQLDFSPTVVAGHDPHQDRFGIELPLVQDSRQVAGHPGIVRNERGKAKGGKTERGKAEGGKG